MTTKELIAVLRRLDPKGDMRVLATSYSDYHLMTAGEVSVEEAVEKPTAFYVMRSHYSMSEKDKLQAKRFIVFKGN